MKINYAIIISIFFSGWLNIYGQINPFYLSPQDKLLLNYLGHENNHFRFEGESWKHFSRFYNSFSQMILSGKGNINIVHIGNSHIQAGFLTGTIRELFGSTDYGFVSSYGFMFPYHAARTNNPPDYSIKSTGNWQYCRNVEKNKICRMGLSGITVSTYDSLCTMEISFTNTPPSYRSFNTFRIYYNLLEAPYTFEFYQGNTKLENKLVVNYEEGYAEFVFNSYIDSLLIRFIRVDSCSIPLEIYGFYVSNPFPGVIYNMAGVNGADSRSFLRCSEFVPHLKSLNPDLIIVSLGTNDSYSRLFNMSEFYANMDTLLTLIEQAAPGKALLLTTPGDHLFKRRYPNPRIMQARNALIDLAKAHHAAVWDFYDVMGGMYSIQKWAKLGLTAKDYLHFNAAGYRVQALLFFEAFLNGFSQYCTRKIN